MSSEEAMSPASGKGRLVQVIGYRSDEKCWIRGSKDLFMWSGNLEGQFRNHVQVFGLSNQKDELSYCEVEGGKGHQAG